MAYKCVVTDENGKIVKQFDNLTGLIAGLIENGKVESLVITEDTATRIAGAMLGAEAASNEIKKEYSGIRQAYELLNLNVTLHKLSDLFDIIDDSEE